MRIGAGSTTAELAHDEGAAPLVFMPQVDWQNFTEPNIIHAY